MLKETRERKFNEMLNGHSQEKLHLKLTIPNRDKFESLKFTCYECKIVGYITNPPLCNLIKGIVLNRI